MGVDYQPSAVGDSAAKWVLLLANNIMCSCWGNIPRKVGPSFLFSLLNQFVYTALYTMWLNIVYTVVIEEGCREK